MSRHKPRHSAISRIVILLLWAGLIAFGASPGAHSEPSARLAGDAAGGDEIPPYTGTHQEGAVGLGQRALTPRTKLIIRLPDVLSWFMLRTERDPNYRARRPAAYPVPEEWQSDVPGCQAVGITTFADVYAIGQSPGGRPVGHLPPATVRAVAFGSIPVTVTLNLSQIIDGQLIPLHADFWSTSTGGACDPSWRAKHPYDPAYVRGRLTLTLSDLSIDGHRVDIGDRCRTVEPLQVNMWAVKAGFSPGGWTPSGGGDLYQREDTTLVDVPGGGLLHPGSTDLTIPAFTGCVSADGEDVSRLLTAAISGPGNEISARQGPVLFVGTSTDFGRNNPAGCKVNPQTGEKICPLPAPTPPDIPVPTD